MPTRLKARRAARLPSAGSETGRAAFGPRIGPGAVPAVDAFDRVCDSRTVTMCRNHIDLVTAPAQIFDPRRVKVVLHPNARGLGIDGEAGRADRGLRVVAVDDHVGEELQVRLR